MGTGPTYAHPKIKQPANIPTRVNGNTLCIITPLCAQQLLLPILHPA